MSSTADEQRSTHLDDYVGFKVEATDGSAGKVARETRDSDRDYFVVKPSLFGKKVEAPGDIIVSVDDGVVRLGVTKDELKSYPRYVDPRKLNRNGGGPGSDTYVPLG